MKKISQENKKKLIRGVVARDIECFGQFFLKNHLKLDTPEFHKEIYRILESDNEAIVRAAPRGHAKSSIVDIVYLLWVICHKKAKFVLLVSDTYSQAALFLEGVKAEIESNDRLKDFFGNLGSDKWSEGEIIANGILIKAVGAGMKVRGLKYRESRPDLVIMDDMENDEMVQSVERRDKLERWFSAALIPSMAKGGRMVVIGTILHYDSLLYKLLSDDKYTNFDKKIYRAINGDKILWPEHLNFDELQEIKEEYIRRGQTFLFYQEYQNDPVSSENQKFKPETFQYYTPEDLKYKQLSYYITIDRAYSTMKTADFTGISIVAVDIENNWYVKAERFKGNELEVIDKIFDLKRYYKPVKLGIEQKAFEHTLKVSLEERMRKENFFFSVEELKDLGTAKNIRIEGLVPRFEAKTIFLLKEDKDLREELERFPAGSHDDLVDSLSYMLKIAEPPNNSMVEMEVPEWDTGEFGLN